jgi:hypothetical protein
MELTLFLTLGILLLVFVFVVIFSLKPISSDQLAKEYLSIGLRELRARIEGELQEIEARKRLLEDQLAHLEALSEVAAKKVED